MAEIDDLARREHAPPLDRLSGVDHRLDSVRSLMQQQGLAVGDLARTLTRVEALHLEQSRRFDRLDSEVAEVQAGIRAILDALPQHPYET